MTTMVPISTNQLALAQYFLINRPDRVDDGTYRHSQTGRTLHGGLTGANLCMFILWHPALLNFSHGSPLPIYELGSNDGAFSFMAAALSSIPVSVHMIEILEHRYCQGSRRWVRGIRRGVSSLPNDVRNRLLHQVQLPIPCHEDYTVGDSWLWKPFSCASPSPCIFFLNNAHGCIRGHIQSTLEDKVLRFVPVGSILISFDTLLEMDTSWQEEMFQVTLPRHQLPWPSRGSNPYEMVQLDIYKYIKVKEYHGASHRPRNHAKTKVLPYEDFVKQNNISGW